ncbi:MerR family transcriptional regulator [Floccifex sp.]|uniref:MerR family transcriptional regulator n=1 Tax=Floccifex sp. TaxID=2815810 RepID=UPI003EFBEE21
MKILEVSQKCGLSKRTIHFYIQEGLLKPKINSQNGYYDFSEEDILQLRFISMLRDGDIPISMIRHILNEPSTASFYFSNYLFSLQQKQEHLLKTIQSIQYILDHLPLHIQFPALYEVVKDAHIPSFETQTELKKDSFLVVRFLWSRFIPDGIQNDFQEFLWTKINRITNEDTTGDVKTLTQYLNSLNPEQLELIFKDNSKHYEFTVNLNEQGCIDYAKELEFHIQKNLKNPNMISYWKQNYHSFYLPNLRLYDSKVLQDIIKQISPFFEKYVANIHIVCELVYQNKELMKEMNQQLMGYIDLDSYHHAAIEIFGYLK